MRGGLVGEHRTGVREDTEVEKVQEVLEDAEVEEVGINPAPVHQYCHKGTNCAGIQSQSWHAFLTSDYDASLANLPEVIMKREDNQ